MKLNLAIVIWYLLACIKGFLVAIVLAHCIWPSSPKSFSIINPSHLLNMTLCQTLFYALGASGCSCCCEVSVRLLKTHNTWTHLYYVNGDKCTVKKAQGWVKGQRVTQQDLGASDIWDSVLKKGLPDTMIFEQRSELKRERERKEMSFLQGK